MSNLNNICSGCSLKDPSMICNQFVSSETNKNICDWCKDHLGQHAIINQPAGMLLNKY